MPLMERSMCNCAFINVKMLLTFVAVLFVCGLTSAQNPYNLKRPSFCSTCFSNDQEKNYHCCFYFFRCCAESRLGSNNRKVTTPGPEYPDQTSSDDVICEQCVPRRGVADDSAKPESDDVADHSDDENVHFDVDGQHKVDTVSKAAEELTPLEVDGADLSQGYFGVKRIAETVYSPAFGGKRYPYNVPRVYPTQQHPKNTEWRAPQRWNSNPSRSNTRYGETSQGSTELRIRENGQEKSSSSEVLWGRMEPVQENIQWT